MPQKVLKLGFKIALRSEAHRGFVLGTNNILQPVGVAPEGGKLQFENAIFQIVSGDGEAGTDLTTRRVGEEIKFGQIVRLIHAQTNSLLCESRRSRATKEKANQKVVLATISSEEAKGSRWRLLPRYKVRSEGEKVCDKDHILLQSVNGATFFHIAATADASTDFFFEVNAGNSPSGVAIHAYDTEQYDREQANKLLRGGDCILLVHKEDSAVIVGKTVDDTLHYEPVSSITIKSSMDSLNSNSMFVIEFDDMFAGGMVYYGQRHLYKLKMLSSGKYLCVRNTAKGGSSSGGGGGNLLPNAAGGGTGSMHDRAMSISAANAGEQEGGMLDPSLELYMSSDPTDKGTCVCFHQATDDRSSFLRSRCRVFIEFPLIKSGGGCWLSIGGLVNPEKPQKALACAKTISHRDGIELQKVKTADFQELNTILALLPPVQRLNEMMKQIATNPELPSAQLITQVRENLASLAKMCTTTAEEDVSLREGTPVSRLQNRLGDQRVPHLCLDLVRNIFLKGSPITLASIHDVRPVEVSISVQAKAGAGANGAAATEQEALSFQAVKYCDFFFVVRMAFHCVRLCCYKNTNLALSVSGRVEELMEFVVKDTLGSLSALREVFRDNPKLVDCPDDMAFVDRFCTLATEQRRSSNTLMAFLVHLCGCNGVAMVTAQSRITHQLSLAKSSGAANMNNNNVKLISFGHTAGVVQDENENSLSGGIMGAQMGAQSAVAGASKYSSLQLEADSIVYEFLLIKGEVIVRAARKKKFGEDEIVHVRFIDICQEDTDRKSGAADTASMMSGSSSIGSGGNAARQTQSGILNYICAQIELLTALCKGRHEANIEIVRRILPIEVALAVIEHAQTSLTVRGLVFEYLICVLVDVPPLEDWRLSSSVVIWSRVVEKSDDKQQDPISPTAKSRANSTPNLDRFKKFLFGYLKQNWVMDPTNRQLNLCIGSASKTVATVARLGLISHDEVVSWVKVLIPVLDGRDDVVPEVSSKYQKRFGKFSRYVYDEDNDAVMMCKLYVLEAINIFTQLVLHHKLQEHLAVLKKQQRTKKRQKTPQVSSILDLRSDSKIGDLSNDMKQAKIKAEEEKNANLLMGGVGMLTGGLGKGLGAMMAVGSLVTSIIPFGKEGDNEDPLDYLRLLIEVLVDNMIYEYAPVVAKSTEMFVTIMNAPLALLKPMDSIQILSLPSGVTFLEQTSPVVRTLRAMVMKTISSSGLAQLPSLLGELTRNLLVNPSDPKCNTVKHDFADILRNMDVHVTVSKVLDALTTQRGVSESEGLPEDLVVVFTAAYRLLCLFVAGSPDSALAVFPFAEVIVRHVTFNVGAIELLFLFFEDNLDLCSSVTDVFLQDLVYVIPRLHFNPLSAALLHMLVFQPGHVGHISRNKDTMLRLLTEAEENVSGIIKARDTFTGKIGRKIRDRLLEAKDYEKPSSRTLYHLEMISTVSDCLGETRDAVRLADLRLAIFTSNTLDDIFEVIGNKKGLPFFFRSPYVKLFRCLFCLDGSQRMSIVEHKKFKDVLVAFAEDLASIDEIALGVYDDSNEDASKPLVNDEAKFNYVFGTLVPCIQTLFGEVIGESFGKDEETSMLTDLETLRNSICEIARLLASLLDHIAPHHPFRDYVVPPTEEELAAAEKKAEEEREANSNIAFRFAGTLLKGATAVVSVTAGAITSVASAAMNLVKFGEEDDDDEDLEQANKDKITVNGEQMKVPWFFHDGVYFTLISHRAYSNIDLQSPVNSGCRSLPYLPLGDITILASSVHVSSNLNLIEANSELTSQKTTFMGLQVPPKNRWQVDDGKAAATVEETNMDAQLHRAFKKYVRRFKKESCRDIDQETMFDAAAQVLLRQCRTGHDAVRSMIRVVDLVKDDDLRLEIFCLLKQVIEAGDEEFCDASILFPVAKELDEPDEGRRKELMQSILSLDKPQVARQNILASLPGRELLAPKMVEMTAAANREIVNSAILAACALLDGGNYKNQTCIIRWAKAVEDEELFVQIRAKMVLCADRLKERRRSIRQEIPDPAKRRERLPDDLHVRLNRRYSFTLDTNLLRMVQLMCEGHNRDMQNYLREQPDNQISINTLEGIVALLEVLSKCIDRVNLPLALQTLATLTEVMQGPCFGNQDFVTSQNIGEIVTTLLSWHFGDCTPEETYSLRMGAITLLLALLEGHMHRQLIGTLISSMHFSKLIALMDSTFIEWAKPRGEMSEVKDPANVKKSGIPNPLSLGLGALSSGFDIGKDIVSGIFVGLAEENEFDDTLNLACSIFTFLKATLDVQVLMLGEDAEQHHEFVDRNGVTIKAALRSSTCFRPLSKRIATVEVLRSGKVERTYFRRLKISTMNLRKATKELIIKDVDRNGDTARLTSFFEMCLSAICEIEYFDEIRKTRGLSVIQKYNNYVDMFALIFAFIINLFLLFGVDYKNDTEINIEPGSVIELFKTMGMVNIVLQVILWVNFFFGPCRIALNEKWKKWQDAKNEKAVKESKESMSIEPPNLEPDAEKKLPFPIHFATSVYMVLTWSPFYRRCAFLATAFLGFYSSPIWYCVQLFQVVEKSAQLQNVFLSVTLNGNNLILTGCLMLIVIYTSSIISYYYFSEYYHPDNLGNGANCDSLHRCFMTMLAYGMRQGGGIGDVLNPPHFYGSNIEGYLRMLYDFMNFLILIILFLNIVFGIILDTFGELRGDRDAIEEDQKGKCFICGLEQSEFDRVGSGGFENHHEFEHHMWDYLFLMHYVKLKSPSDHTGPEGFVKECIDSCEPNFFPVGRSLLLECTRNRANAPSDEDEEGGGGGEDGGQKEDDNGDAASDADSRQADGGTDAAEVEKLKEQLSRVENLLAQLVKKK